MLLGAVVSVKLDSAEPTTAALAEVERYGYASNYGYNKRSYPPAPKTCQTCVSGDACRVIVFGFPFGLDDLVFEGLSTCTTMGDIRGLIEDRYPEIADVDDNLWGIDVWVDETDPVGGFESYTFYLRTDLTNLFSIKKRFDLCPGQDLVLIYYGGKP